MDATLIALIPVFLIIVMGAALGRFAFSGDGEGSERFWSDVDRLTYYILFPALIIHTLASADLASLIISEMIIALAAPVLVIALLLGLLRPFLFAKTAMSGPVFTSLFQGSIRPNTYVGLAAAFALFGDPGLTLAAVAVATLVPLVNLLSASVLSSHGENSHSSHRARLILVSRNPLIIACVLGLALNLSSLGLPSFVSPFLDLLGRAALTLGLLSVGASLQFKALLTSAVSLWLAVGLKLIALPLMTWWLLGYYDVGGITAKTALLFAALPTSATAFVMARQLGGDHVLMAGIITIETVLAILTLPAVLLFLT